MANTVDTGHIILRVCSGRFLANAESISVCIFVNALPGAFLHHYFWATISKTVCPMLSDRCLSCLSVCDVGVLWPNGCVDRDATWYGGRPRPRLHCVRWDPATAELLLTVS